MSLIYCALGVSTSNAGGARKGHQSIKTHASQTKHQASAMLPKQLNEAAAARGSQEGHR
jgi:hypothetical protein